MKHEKTLKATGLLAAAALLVLAALGSAEVPTSVKTTDFTSVPIRYGSLVNKNISIESFGSEWERPFMVEGGKNFDTPFSVHWWDTAGYFGLEEKNVLDNYQLAYEHGARPIRIMVDGESEPLYGLIVFNVAIPPAFGPAKQSYYVKIPDDKLQQALNGNITVAYERIRYRDSWTYDGTANSNTKSEFSWIVWMSRTPLVESGRAMSR